MHTPPRATSTRRGVGDVYTMTLEEDRKARWYVKVELHGDASNPAAMS